MTNSPPGSPSPATGAERRRSHQTATGPAAAANALPGRVLFALSHPAPGWFRDGIAPPDGLFKKKWGTNSTGRMSNMKSGMMDMLLP